MAGSSSEEEENYWPGFVDALTTMTMVLTFILMVLGIVVFSLSQTVNRAHLEAIAEAANVKSDPKSNPAELKDAIIARIATLAQAGPPLKDIPKVRELGIMATSGDKPTELPESTAVVQPKSDSIPAENQNGGPAQVALAEPAPVPFARPTNGGIPKEVKQASGERNTSNRVEIAGPEAKFQTPIDPAAPPAQPTAPLAIKAEEDGKSSQAPLQAIAAPATPAGQLAALPDQPAELAEADSLTRDAPAAPSQAKVQEYAKADAKVPPPVPTPVQETPAETRPVPPPAPSAAPSAPQPVRQAQNAPAEDVGKKVASAEPPPATQLSAAPKPPARNAEPASSQAASPAVAAEPSVEAPTQVNPDAVALRVTPEVVPPEVVPPVVVPPPVRPEVVPPQPATPVAETQIRTAALQPTKKVDPLVQEGELIESTMEPVFAPRKLGAKVTSDGSFITVKFVPQSTSLSPDEQTQVRTALRDEKALAARSVEILAIAGIATSDLTEERRRAYFRMMSLRNELISSGISSNKIKLLVRDSKNPDDFNVVRISAR
jgi:Na+-transporting methylmalonyl-CoA/oxaloacetate decarboxylase gamma subunit